MRGRMVAALLIAGIVAGCSGDGEDPATSRANPPSKVSTITTVGIPAVEAPTAETSSATTAPEVPGPTSEVPASLPGVNERDETGDVLVAIRQLPADKQALIDSLDPTIDCASTTADPAPIAAEAGAKAIQVARVVNGCVVIEVTAVAEGDLETSIAAANAEPDVVAADGGSFASIDGTTDPSIADQRWWLDDLRVSELDALSVPAGAPKVRVAVIDTGIDDSHPDLAGLVTDRGSWAGPLTNPHGTHVAGIIAAAAGNGVTGRGVASGQVELLDVNFETGRTVASLIAWAVDRGAQVINMSFCESENDGDPCQTTPNMASLAAVANARHRGVLLFASAGNCGPGSYEADPLCAGVANRAQFPSGYDGVIAVGAYEPSGTVAPFSTRNESVDVSAPGDPITSTGFSGEPLVKGGTSQATPMVSASAAMLLAHRPDVPSGRILSALFAFTRDAGPPGWDDAYGSGRIDPIEAARRIDDANPADAERPSRCVRRDIDFAAVRASATTAAEQVGQLAAGQCDVAFAGDSANVDRSGEMWLAIEIDGTIGWSAARLFDVASLDRDTGLIVAFSRDREQHHRRCRRSDRDRKASFGPRPNGFTRALERRLGLVSGRRRHFGLHMVELRRCLRGRHRRQADLDRHDVAC